MKVPPNGIVYKFLGPGRKPCHGGRGVWPRPGAWTPELTGLVPCEHGYHVCRAHQLLDWLGPELWSAEWRGKNIDAGTKLVVGEARLIARIKEWNDRTARLFACDCAERVVRLTGPDERCVAAIAVARRYANGEATGAELFAARAAATAAATDVAWDAVSDAVSDAATAAARAAATAAAMAAASDAARAAATAAAWDVARAAERLWQINRLLEILGIKNDA